MTILSGTSTLRFSGSPTTWNLGSGLQVFNCTAAGVGGNMTINTWTPKSGQASAGPGGGWNGGSTLPQDWGADVNVSSNLFPLTGFIDDGSNYPNPSGIMGNVLTVTVQALPNIAIDSVNGASISGTGVTTAKVIAAIGGATGGVGRYTLNGSPQLVNPAQSMNTNIPDFFDGGWSASTNITCTSLDHPATASYMFLDFQLIGSANGPPAAGFTTPVAMTNNLLDVAAWGAAYGNGGWNQRGNAGTSISPLPSVTFPVTSFIDDGLGGGSYDATPGNTLTVTVPGTTWFVYANSTHGATVGGVGVTTATITADGTGTGGIGTYTINGSAQAVASETMNVEIAGCSVVAQFNGNQDISGLYTDAYWNAWHATIAKSGC